MKQPAIYILANRKNGTLYTGVTTDLIRRIYEHKQKLVEGFAKKYNCTQLVYYELYDTIESAIIREKQLKAGARNAKTRLIEHMNQGWRDLYGDILFK